MELKCSASTPAETLFSCSLTGNHTVHKILVIHILHYSDSLVPPTSSTVPAPQQLLDILLEDESLQHHLAHLINSSLLR